MIKHVLRNTAVGVSVTLIGVVLGSDSVCDRVRRKCSRHYSPN